MKQKNVKKENEQKEFLGMPMNWDSKNMFKNLWNKDDDRLFPPKSFGIGWTINFHAVLRKAGILETKKKNEN